VRSPREAVAVPQPTGDCYAALRAYDWDYGTAAYVVEHESQGRAGPPASPTGDYGCMQIHYAAHYDKLYQVTGSYEPTLLFDPAVNVAVGYLVYQANSGWSPWRVCDGAVAC